MDARSLLVVCACVMLGQLSPVLSQMCDTSETCDFTVTTAGVEVFIVEGRDYCFNCTSSPADWMVGNFAAGDLTGLQAFSNGILEICDVGTVTDDVGSPFNVVCGDGLVYMLRRIRIGDPVVMVDPVAPVHEGMNVTLSCARGINTIVAVYSISWIDPSGTVLVEQQGASSLDYTVVGITRDQAGEYTCSVAVELEDSLANQTSDVTVTVYYAPSIQPGSLLPVLAPVNTSVTLTCTFDGLPAPNITWAFNGKLLSMDLFEFNETYTELTLDLLTNGDTGEYTCTATNVVSSSMAKALLNVQVPPDPPTNLEVSDVTEDSASLSWMNGFVGFSELTSAVVRYQADQTKYPGDPLRELTVDTPPFDSASLTSLTPYTTHTITVSLVNAIGEGGPISNSTTTLSLELPQPLLTLSVLSSQELSAEWMLSSYNASTTAPLTSWMLAYERKDKETMDYVDPKIKNFTAASPPSPLFQQSFNLTGLEKGTEYRAMVVGTNVRGPSPASAYAMAETSVDPPSEPLNLEVYTVNFERLRLQWEAPADDGGRPIDYYLVRYMNVSSGSYNSSENATETVTTITERVDSTQLVYGLTGLLDNTSYIVNVSAGNELFVGPPATGEGTTLSLADPQPILAMPTLGTGADGNEPTYDTANVTWAHPGGTVDQFVVQYRVDTGGGARRAFEPWVGAYEVTVNGTQLYALLTELTAATDYEAQVASRNTNGQSEFSPPIKFTTAPPTPSPIPPRVDVLGPEGSVEVGEGVTLVCVVEGLEGEGEVVWSPLPEGAVMSGYNLSFEAVETQNFTCSVGNYSDFYVLTVDEQGSPLSTTVIIVVAVVGGVAVALLVVAIVVAICYFCCIRKKKSTDPYTVSGKKSNWIEASTGGGSYVPKTQQGSFRYKSTEEGDAGFDYPESFVGHSSFNTLDKDGRGPSGSAEQQPEGQSAGQYSNTVV